MSEMKWISVEERLPEPYTDVLAYWFVSDEFHVAYFSGEQKLWRRQFDDYPRSPPSYWAPLPAPPNEMTQKEGE